MGQDTIDGEPRFAMHFDPGYQFEDGIERYRIGCLDCGYASAAVKVEALDDIQAWMEAHVCIVKHGEDRAPELWYSLAHRGADNLEEILTFLDKINQAYLPPLGFDDQTALQRARTVLYRAKDVEVRLRGA